MGEHEAVHYTRDMSYSGRLLFTGRVRESRDGSQQQPALHSVQV
jgi:hypothetical protein